MDYQEFIFNKTQLDGNFGFEPDFMPDFMFGFQKAVTEWAVRKGRAAIFEDCGLGKGQPYGSNILTPNGWKKIEELNIGDEVISSNGKPSKVSGVYPKQEQDTYRIWFSDDSSYVVDLDHLHICRTNNDRQRNKEWRVLSTKELLECRNLRYGKDQKSRNYDIPIVEDVEFNSERLLIHPYVLGCLLGDGHLKGNFSLSNSDMELIDRVKKLIGNVKLKKSDKYDWRFITGLTGSKKHPFRQLFVDLGLYGLKSYEKFIPGSYLFSSPLERLELLRGLMDTDGYVEDSGCSQFYSVSYELAKGVMFLIQSLGGIPKLSMKETSLNGQKHRDCYVVTFSLKTHNPFYISRKSKKWNSNPRDNGRWIDRIEYEKKQKTICISVDSEDSSYVTENFIVTHNTVQELVWSQNIYNKTKKPILILTPLAVTYQFVEEAKKFGIEAKRSIKGEIESPIVITNYERLHFFNSDDFGGVVCDESSILKNFDGKYKSDITEFMRLHKFRLLATATAAPNDFTEVGTSSEALGYLGYMDMLGRFFTNRQNTTHAYKGLYQLKDNKGWRFKGHAEDAFWRWVTSWARSLRKPSDLGFEDNGFILPPLTINDHVIQASTKPDNMLINIPAIGWHEVRAERKRTIKERCEEVAKLVSDTGKPAVVWCNRNEEGDLLEKIISDAVQVSGKDKPDSKEEKFKAFSDGEIRVLVTKPKIGAWGLNWQHCNHVTYFPTDSYEQYYQAVRRCYRFGQKNEVIVDRVSTDGEVNVLKNMDKKQKQADKMFTRLVKHMTDSLEIERSHKYNNKLQIPNWL